MEGWLEINCLKFIVENISDPVARMLLLNDGSTTIILQALLGIEKIDVSVLYQKTLQNPVIRNDFKKTNFDILRKTKIMYNNMDISHNHVLINSSTINLNLKNSLLNSSKPLGLLLMEQSKPTRRSLMTCGIISFKEMELIFPGQKVLSTPYYFREYSIQYNFKIICIVKEYFNPKIIQELYSSRSNTSVI